MYISGSLTVYIKTIEGYYQRESKISVYSYILLQFLILAFILIYISSQSKFMDLQALN